MTTTGNTVQLMTNAALAFLDSLSPEHRVAASIAFDDSERQRWFYTPTDHGGVVLSAVSSLSQQWGLRLLASGLSDPGFATASSIMALENVLDRNEGWARRVVNQRGRDPLRYFVSVFGVPGERVWGWRFGGHHLSYSVTIVDEEVASTSPLFFGAYPAQSPLMGGQWHRPLASVEDVARALLHSLDADQLRLATLCDVAPSDLVTANRPRVVEGALALPLWAVFRDPFTGAQLEAMQSTQHALDVVLGATDESRAAVAYSTVAKGLSGSLMSATSRDLMGELLRQYVGRLPDDVAAGWDARIGSGSPELSFAWAGGVKPGQPHYYRVQGPRVLAEYDNTQNDVNHVHAVLRDPLDDFGADTLARHYRGAH